MQNYAAFARKFSDYSFNKLNRYFDVE